ncbi:Satratoxin biosynthesis SC1 cluster protein 4 [Colletotrichum tropicale]|nr:Satratoxin biosynthesis SC1 cluster protein 4 [Colletotrichum tropicale]
MAVDPFIEAAFGPPPDGVDLTESQATKNNAIVIVLLVIAALSVAGRLVARSKYGPGLSLDDYAIVVAWVLVAATAGMVIAIGQAGAGRHVWALSVDDLLLYIYSFVFCTAVLSTKISILLFYWRVFMGNLLSFRFSIWIGAFLVGSYPIYFMITMGFCCNPLSHYWTQFKGTTGTCLDVGHFFFILAIINLITDVILLAIPVPEILKLQMSKDKKIAVCGILGLGGFVCIASAVRVHYLKVFSTATDTDLQGAINFWISEAGKLEPERRALFLRVSNATSYEGYVTDLAKTIKDTSNLSKVSRLSRKMKPIYQLSNSIAPIVTSASQFTPMPASLVLGGITCILSLSTRVDDFQSKLLETLEWMADEVDLINDYRHERIFDGDVAVEACEINLAADILKFCIEVTKLFYDDSGRQKSSLIFALKGLCKDFDVRFGDIKTDFKLHLTSLEKRRDLVNARKLRLVHVGLYDIGKMLKREHEDRGRVDRAESRVGWHHEERRRRFLDWLPTLDFGEIQENNFERRVPGSGDWLLDHEDFQTWKASPVSTLLWIHGKPGSGKSHLAARVIHDLSPSPSQTDKTAVAFAYCTATQTKTRMTMNNVLGAILGQLYKQLPITESIETLLSRSDNSAKEDPQRSEMKEGIRTVVCRLRSSYIVVDGLDECSHFPDHQFEDLCNFIASLAEIKDAGVSARILVLSRPE